MSRADPSAVTPCQPWGLWASLGWGLVAVAAWFAAQFAIAHALIGWLDGVRGANIAGNALAVSIVTIGAMPAGLIVVAIAARAAGCRVTDYLALQRPTRRHLLIGLAALAVLIPLVDLLSWLGGREITPRFVTDLYRNARDTGTLVLLVLALAGAAPLVEEVLFRGFLLPGLAASALGPVGAVLLTSLIWAVMHLQYEPFYLFQVVALGIAFGWLRLASGSTLLTILLHALVNLIAVAQAGVIVEWLS